MRTAIHVLKICLRLSVSRIKYGLLINDLNGHSFEFISVFQNRFPSHQQSKNRTEMSTTLSVVMNNNNAPVRKLKDTQRDQ